MKEIDASSYLYEKIKKKKKTHYILKRLQNSVRIILNHRCVMKSISLDSSRGASLGFFAQKRRIVGDKAPIKH